MDYNHQINDKVELGKVMFSSVGEEIEKKKKRRGGKKRRAKKKKEKKRAKKEQTRANKMSAKKKEEKKEKCSVAFGSNSSPHLWKTKKVKIKKRKKKLYSHLLDGVWFS